MLKGWIYEERWLYLQLITSATKNPFVDKLKSYNDNPLLNQQAEIKDFLTEGKAEWRIPQILERTKSILEFADSRWTFGKE